MKKIAIVGCGSTGHALAALLAQRGHEVRLTDGPAYADMLRESARMGVIKLDGYAQGAGAPAKITPDVADALNGAELVICCTISNRDEEVARMIAPYVDESKSVLIGAGNCGSLVYRRIFDECGKSGVLLGEVGGNFFPCRLSADRTATIGLPLGPKAIAAFPPRDTPRLAEAFREVWDFTPVQSILFAAFNGPNLITHPAGAVLNAAAIENSGGTFNLFQDGVSPGFIRLVDRIWEEKRAVFEALGFTPAPSPRKMFEGILDERDETYRYFRQMGGPGSLDHRYITEDVPLLICMFISVARALGVDVPLYEGMVNLLSAVAGDDFYARGRTLENLGLGGLSREEVLAYFCG